MIDLEIPLQRLTVVTSGMCSASKSGRRKSFSSSNITYCFGELVIILEIGQKLSSSGGMIKADIGDDASFPPRVCGTDL